MGIGYAGTASGLRGKEGSTLQSSSIAGILRLLGAGAPAAILLALRNGPLRTKVLTQCVGGYTARTIYRHVPKLVQLGLVDREEGRGIGSGVVHSLTNDCGTELCSLIERFAAASETELPNGQVEVQAWTPLGVLADLWEAGVIGELSWGAHSPTELARELNGLSYHQLSRRTGLVNTAGFLCEVEHAAWQRRCYALTGKCRRTMGLIAGIIRWRDRHMDVEEDETTLEEMVTVLRSSLPPARLPQHSGKHLGISLVGESERSFCIEVGDGGAIHPRLGRPKEMDAWAEGDGEAWLDALLDGHSGVMATGDKQLIGDCLRELYDALWTPGPL